MSQFQFSPDPNHVTTGRVQMFEIMRDEPVYTCGRWTTKESRFGIVLGPVERAEKALEYYAKSEAVKASAVKMHSSIQGGHMQWQYKHPIEENNWTQFHLRETWELAVPGERAFEVTNTHSEIDVGAMDVVVRR
jgi:hypothetical protein